MALAQMDIAPSSTVWDVGAGSGSVSVEAAQLAADGSVYAIEMDAAGPRPDSRECRTVRRGECQRGARRGAGRL